MMLFIQSKLATNEMTHPKTDYDDILKKIKSMEQVVSGDPEKFKLRATYFISGEMKCTDGKLIRNDEALLSRDLIPLDFEHFGTFEPEWFTAKLKARNIRALLYCTARHTKQEPRYRVLIPLASPITDHKTYVRNIHELELVLGVASDKKSHAWSQPAGVPCKSKDSFEPILVEGDNWEVIEATDKERPAFAEYQKILEPGIFDKVNSGSMIPEGERDDSIYRYACALRGKGFDRETAEKMVFAINGTQVKPPLDDKIVMKKIDQAWKHDPPHGGIAFPDVRQFANGNVRILPTKENVRAILKHLGIKLYYDVILRRVIIEKEGNSVSVNSDSAELLAIHLADLAVLIDIKSLQNFVYDKMATGAGLKADGLTLTDQNVYTAILAGSEAMDNAEVPDTGRVLVVTPATYTLLKKATDFDNTGISDELKRLGVVGMLDGMAVVKVPANRLPEDIGFMIAHPSATVAPVKLEDYSVHADTPLSSGSIVTGRIIYDAFVLENKSSGIYVHPTNATAEVVKLTITGGATDAGDVTVTLDGDLAVPITLTADDDEAAEVATKIHAGTFTGWTAAKSDGIVTFTAAATGQKGSVSFDAGDTGVVATIAKTTVGV